MANVWPKSENDPNGGIAAVHSERLVRDAAGVRIEMVDAWVDPVTKGVRKIGAATLPLKLVTSTRGLEVYAARDDRDNGKQKIVQYVVVPPTDVPNSEHETLVAMHQGGRSTTSSSCSHLRVALYADDKSAESVILRATLRLPRSRDEGTRRRRRRRRRREDGTRTRGRHPARREQDDPRSRAPPLGDVRLVCA